MSQDTTKEKNIYKKELSQQQEEWIQDKGALEQEKNKLGFAHKPLRAFLGDNFINSKINKTNDEQIKSAIKVLHEQVKTLEKRYKLLWPEENVIRELNKKHAVIHIDQTYILTEKINVLGQEDFSLESRASFKAYYEDESIINSNGKKQNKADIWLKSPNRRKYSGIVSDPTSTNHTKNNYNIWKGFARSSKKNSPPKYWKHVKNNICSGNEEHYLFLRKWLAYIFQRPDEVHTALVLCGSQGVGKNCFVEPLGILLGQHYILLSSITELISNFNSHLKNAVLIHANEALWGGNRKDVGTVKAMITERTCLIEGKGKDRIMVKNFKHLILSSNEEWPVHIDADDRRFFVLRVSNAHKEDHKYFELIQEELNDGGYEGLLFDLLNEDISEFNPRKLPHSNEAFAIKMQSADSAIRYLYEALCSGYLSLEDTRLYRHLKC